MGLQTPEQQADKAGGDEVGQQPEDHRPGLWSCGHDNLEAALHGKVSLEDAPQSRVDADPPIRHNYDVAADCQSACKRGACRIAAKQPGNVAILGIGQKTAVQSVGIPWPVHAHFPNKLENALCPCMRGKDIALQAVGMPHEGPAHAARSQGRWLDVQLIDLVNAWANLFIIVEGVWSVRIVSNAAFCPQLPDFFPKKVKI